MSEFEVVAEAEVKPRKARARKVAAPAESVKVPVAVAAQGPVYVARKTLRLNGRLIKPGTVVPEASSWPRVESWVRAGYIDVKGA